MRTSNGASYERLSDLANLLCRCMEAQGNFRKKKHGFSVTFQFNQVRIGIYEYIIMTVNLVNSIGPIVDLSETGEVAIVLQRGAMKPNFF